MPAPAFKIPLTELRHLYGMFDLFTSLDCHRALAKEVLRDKNPGLLVSMFQRSVERFHDYANIEEPFIRNDLLARTFPMPQRSTASMTTSH